MRILFTQETDWLERNPHQQHHLAEMLSLRGHEIRVIDYELTMFYSLPISTLGYLVGYLKWRMQNKKEPYSRRKVFSNISKIHDGAGITVIRPGIIKIPVLDYVSLVFSHKREIQRQINEFKPDVIVGWGILNSYLAVKAARRNNISFLYYWIDVLDRLIPLRLFQRVGRLVESKTLEQSDKILVINDKLRDYVIELGAKPERTQVVRAGIDIGQFNPSADGNTRRKQYRLSDQDIVLFFMGWLYRFSGLKEVALQLTQSGNSKLKLLVVGEGDAYEELHKICEKYNLQGRLILTGKKAYQEIPGLIAASDICLLPAYPWEKIMQDIVPVKMYEYMAMKKPVIATRLPGVMKEFGEDSGVVYVDTPDDVAAEALELLQNGKVEELGLKARCFIGRYSWDGITDEFEGILGRAIKEKRNE